MSRWTVDQVLALAPDPSAVGPARELAGPAKWVRSGCNDLSVWGEAQGSGSKPYQTAIDLQVPAFKCSCPSRKFPCKHALGLFIRYAQDQVAADNPPGWVTEWLEKRNEKTTKQAAKIAEPKKEADPETSAKRAAKRWDNVLDGLDECESFLLDVAGQGLLASQSARNWDQMAARMVDAQAPGVARRLKSIGSSIGVGADWAPGAVAGMGNLMLLIEAARHAEGLGEATRADIRGALGIPLKKEEIGGEKVVDRWDIIGQTIEVEDRITTCRSWLRGRETRRWAMHLAFSVASQPYDMRLTSGTAIDAELEFYPSAWPLRAIVAEPALTDFKPSMGEGWAGAFERMSDGLAACPWLEQIPIVLSQATLARVEPDGFAVDKEGIAMRVKVVDDPWNLLALTGNQPCTLFGEWNGTVFRLLGAWGEWGYCRL